MDLAALREVADRQWKRGQEEASDIVTPLPNLAVLRTPRATELRSTLYEPSLCLILRGAKETHLGERAVRFGAGECLLISHELPVVSRIIEADPAAPYLAVVLFLERPLLRGLYDELSTHASDDTVARSMQLGSPGPHLVDAFRRYLELADDAVAARVLGPQILREMHFRLLRSPFGAMLRQLLRHDSYGSRVGRAIERIRGDFRGRLPVPELARSVGMSTSAFHHHFKAITAKTPLQYQKELRLLEARRLLTSGAMAVSEVAYTVGYASPTQFSREFARTFGHPPSVARATA